MPILLILFIVVFHKLSQVTTGSLKIFGYFVQNAYLFLKQDTSKRWSDWLGFFNLDLVSASSGNICVVPLSQPSRMFRGLVIPLFYFAALGVIFVLHYVGIKIRIFYRRRRQVWTPGNNYSIDNQQRDAANNMVDKENFVNGVEEGEEDAAAAATEGRLKTIDESETKHQLESKENEDDDLPEETEAPVIVRHKRGGASYSVFAQHSISRIPAAMLPGAEARGGLTRVISPIAAPTKLFGKQIQKGMYFRTFVALYMFTVTTFTTTVFEFLDCLDLGNGEVRVRKYPAVSCDSTTYRTTFPVMLFVLAFVAFIIPLVLAYRLVNAKRANLLDRKRFRRQWGVILDCYKTRFYYWEIFYMTRRSILAAVAVLLSNHADKFGSLTLINISILAVHLGSRPFIHKLDNQMESLSLAILAFLSSSLSIADRANNERNDIFIAIMVLATLTVLFSYLIISKTGHLFGVSFHRAIDEVDNR